MHCSSNHVCTCTCAYRYVYMSYLSMCHAPLVHPFSMLPNWPPHSGQARWLAAGWGTLFPTGGPLCVQTRRVSVWGQLPRRGWGFHSVRLLVVASVWQSEPACSPPLPSLSSAPPSHRAQEEGLTTCQSWVCWEAVLALPLVPVQ